MIASNQELLTDAFSFLIDLSETIGIELYSGIE